MGESKVEVKYRFRSGTTLYHIPQNKKSFSVSKYTFLNNISGRFLVDKAALGQVFSEYFCFPCQSSFHQFIHHHNHPGLAQ
jgi:hypothetical protein